MSRQQFLYPHPSFPLSIHRNGQWCKHVWCPKSRRSRTYYFGPVSSDPKGERALLDPSAGFLARWAAIQSGADHLRRARGPISESSNLSLAELVKRYLQNVKERVDARELSLRTLDVYMRELRKFVEFIDGQTPVTALQPEHFSTYMLHLTSTRRLGNCARRRVRTDITAMLNFGRKNGWYPPVPTGAAWRSPPVDKTSLRLARLRSGTADHSDRLITGDELDKLLAKATPLFRAIMLLMINCGLGPADIGRLKWKHLDLERGRLTYPRHKTGVERRAYLWKKTREALLKVRTIKRIAAAIGRDDLEAPVFISERGNLMYRESAVVADVEVDGKKIRKTVRVKVENAVSITIRRLIRVCNLPPGLRPYGFRHAAKTYAKRARDTDAVNLMMGHLDRSIPGVYDHEEISWRRLRRVALAIKRRLWPEIKPKEAATAKTTTMGECVNPGVAA